MNSLSTLPYPTLLYLHFDLGFGKTDWILLVLLPLLHSVFFVFFFPEFVFVFVFVFAVLLIVIIAMNVEEY